MTTLCNIAHDEIQIVNRTERSSVNFYNANIGICRNFRINENHHLGLTVGGKLYYGPYFREIAYYNQGGYSIFADSFYLRVSTGIDLGIYYSFRRISALIKYDTARKQLRFGIGYRFMKS